VNSPKPTLANMAVTRSNTCFIMRAQLYGSQERQEIPRPRKLSGLGMTRKRRADSFTDLRRAKGFVVPKALGTRNQKMSGSKSTNKNRSKIETGAGQEGKLSAPVGWDNVQALRLTELSA
jgi:hypothetical protein